MRVIGKQAKAAFFAFFITSLISIFLLSGPLERLNIDILILPLLEPSNDIVIVAIDEVFLPHLILSGHGQENFMEC